MLGLLLVAGIVLSQSLAWNSTAAAGGRSGPNAKATLARTASPSPTPSLLPAHRLALGITQRPYADISRVDAFAQQMGGREPASWTIWSDWLGQNAAFPSPAFLDDLWRRRIVPLIFWQPDDPGHPESEVITYRAIAAGRFDSYIHAWARSAAQWGGPLIVRFAHEMDGTWF